MFPVEEDHRARGENEHDESEGDEEDERRGRELLLGEVHAEPDDGEGEADEDGCDRHAPLNDAHTPRVQR